MIMSPRFVFTFLLCTILILLAVYTGINNYQAELKEHSAAIGLNKKNLESQQAYSALAGAGTKINRKPQVLSTIVSGIWEAVGRVATVNIAYDPNDQGNEETDKTTDGFSENQPVSRQLIGERQFQGPLFLFSHDGIVSEKNRKETEHNLNDEGEVEWSKNSKNRIAAVL